MGEITTIGLDLAKHVFQVHGVDAEGATVLRKQLRRAQVLAFFSRLPPCLVGLEACATAHYWARELRALGHEVRLMPAQYVKASATSTMPPMRRTAAPPLRSGQLPFQGSQREPTNSAHNLSPSTRSKPFGPNKHRTDRLWQCRRQRLRPGERANVSEARISSVNCLSCRYRSAQERARLP